MFTSGIDLSEFMSFDSLREDSDIAKKGKPVIAYIRDWQSCITDLERCRKPVIAAIHSACIGGGVDFVTAADIRICTRDAYFQVTIGRDLLLSLLKMLKNSIEVFLS